MSKLFRTLCILTTITFALIDTPRSTEARDLTNTDAANATSSAVTAATFNGCTGTTSPLYRYWNASASDHFYTTNFAELRWGGGGYSIEGTSGSLLESRFASCGAVPLYRYYNPSATDHFYTTNWGELGWGSGGWYYEGVQGYCFPSPTTGTTPLYRYWNGGVADHFYTTSFAELRGGGGGYVLEGIQCYVSP